MDIANSAAPISGFPGAVPNGRIHYQTFHHVFLYLTERCQLRCGHCYMGTRHLQPQTMSLQTAQAYVTACHKLGARNLTFVGGEPTLSADLPALVEFAVDLGYTDINVDTNGWTCDFLLRIAPERLRYVRISLDGSRAASHDRVRGDGAFARAIESIRMLTARGFRVGVTSTIFSFNIDEIPGLFSLSTDFGISLLNLHVFSEEGLGAERPEWSVHPQRWMRACDQIQELARNCPVSVWYPPTWVSPERMDRYVAMGFRGCLGVSLDRLSVFPDGSAYVCSLLFDHKINFAHVDATGLKLNRAQNEFELFTGALQKAPAPWLSGCPAEALFRRPPREPGQPQMISVCRCWKAKA